MKLVDLIRVNRSGDVAKSHIPEFHTGHPVKLIVDDYVIEGFLDGLSFTHHSPGYDWDGDMSIDLYSSYPRASRIRERSTATLTLGNIIVTARRT